MFHRTARLLLRPTWPEDVPALHRAIADEAIVRNLACAPWPYTSADAEAFVRRPDETRRPAFSIFLHTGRDPVLIGGVGVADDGPEDVELGYWIARDHWGRGYATEAAAAVIDIARDTLRLPRLVAGHFIDNPASGRVLRKLGFRPCGSVRPRFSLARGKDAPCAQLELPLQQREAAPPTHDLAA